MRLLSFKVVVNVFPPPSRCHSLAVTYPRSFDADFFAPMSSSGSSSTSRRRRRRRLLWCESHKVLFNLVTQFRVFRAHLNPN